MPTDLPKDSSPDPEKEEPAEPVEHETESVTEKIEPSDVQPVAGDQQPIADEEASKDIQDTLEVLDAVDKSYEAVIELTNRSYIKGARKIFKTLDEYRDAVDQIEDVPDELADLDEQEIKKLAAKSLSIAKQFVHFNG
jgi:hypothetical protein